MRSPFPEEANRKLACPLVSIHFPPTETSRNNLLQELVSDEMIKVTGNTVIDALHLEIERQASPENQAPLKSKLTEAIGQLTF